ncbi:MAG: hypothetical protein ACR2F8_08045 [Caulobacteraceae bacterium]
MKRFVIIVCVTGLALALAACAAGTPEASRAAAGGPLSQLLLGFWHGIIAPLTLLVEVIQKLAPNLLHLSWRMYGGGDSIAYDIGFYFGLAGGPTVLWSRRWR